MAQVKLNKSSLSQEKKNLKSYSQFVPSLDMKRRKVLLEKNKAYDEFAAIKKNLAGKEKEIANNFPMIADQSFDLNNLIKVESTTISDENIVGVRLPQVKQINFNEKKYEYFNSPVWLDDFVIALKNLIEMKIRLQNANARILLLDKALKTVTQRKNLFEKVLIPKTKKMIRYIQIFLADNERAAVVRSKIAKKKRQLK